MTLKSISMAVAFVASTSVFAETTTTTTETGTMGTTTTGTMGTTANTPTAAPGTEIRENMHKPAKKMAMKSKKMHKTGGHKMKAKAKAPATPVAPAAPAAPAPAETTGH